MPNKIMIVTDSNGNPRSFPASELVELEGTYPYLVRDRFKGSTFWQLSHGNITTSQLVSQPMGYLTHWHPDIIIAQSGLTDCRPEAFSDLEKDILNKLTWKFFDRFKKYMDHPAWIRHRHVYRSSKSSFRTAIRKFQLVFSRSKIFWLEIFVDPRYEQQRPGVSRRIAEYNEIIKEVYGGDFVPVQQKIMDVDGFNSRDHEHLNVRGHQAVADILIERVELSLKAPKDR